MRAVLKAYTLSECMEIMAEYAAELERGGKENVIFCEDRLTLIAERALVKRTGGTFASSVSTFSRFLKADGRAISKQGSVMAVGEIMTSLQRENKLQCFTSASVVGNSAKSIYETLAQFSASEITPEVLQDSLAALPDDMLKKKTADLALIYQGYADFLRDNAFLDESRYLSMLPVYIRQSGVLKGKNVIFLCYRSFTAQARQTIRAALETADSVIGIFCAGEEELYRNSAVNAFVSTCEEYGKVRIRALGKPLDGDAERLRKGLFNPERTGNSVSTNRIHIFEAEDKLAEAEYVAVQIRRIMQEKQGARYRDFALLVPDVGGYSLSIKKAFDEYKIPYFVDEKKSLKRHPLSRFLLDCFRVVKERFSVDSVQSLAGNYFFGESDEYRNYLLKFANYRGGAKREIKTGEGVERFDFEKLQSGRNRVLLATENIKARGHGRVYCAAVEKILTDFDVENKLFSLEQDISDVAQKGYLAQIYKTLEKLLAEAELLTGGKEMTVAEFEAILKDGLDATEISLIPLKADAVFIGDITDSRIEKVSTLFAVGLTEDVPRVGSDTAIVSDKEIARLAEVKALLEPTVAEVNLRNRESVCLNLCTFLDDLYLTYPLSADGSEPAISEIFRYVDRLFCEENGGKLLRRKKYEPTDFRYRASAPAPAIRRLLTEKAEYEMRLTADIAKGERLRKYSSLFTALDKLGVNEKDNYLAERVGQVRVERGKELFFHDGKISPTSLEGYFECPFKHFAQRGLKLKEREEAAVLAVDTGNFIHTLLEEVAKAASWIQSEEEMRAYAMHRGAELLKTSAYAMQQDTASDMVFGEKLLKEGADVAVAAYRQIAGSDFSVEDTEKEILTDEFHGKVDRVDGTEKYVRVIDYKTGKIDDSATSYYTGRKIQMQLYMSKLKGERIPAGVFYFPASVDYSDDLEGKFRMHGFMNGDREALLCGDKNLTEEKKSEFFPAALKNTATTKRVMDEQTFRDFLDYSVLVARQGCKELKEGNIMPSPYDKNCEYCKYGGMCGFDKDSGGKRSETAIDPATIARIAEQETRGTKE